MIKAALSERRSLLSSGGATVSASPGWALKALKAFLVYSAGQPVKSAQKWNLLLSDMELLETAGNVIWPVLITVNDHRPA